MNEKPTYEQLAKEIAELREITSFQQLLLNMVPQLVSYIDKNHTFRFANKAYEKYFNVDSSSMIGKHPKEVLGEAAFCEVFKRHEAAISGQEQEYESSFLLQNGEPYHFHAHYLPHIVEGEVEGFLAVVQDLTKLKETEADLQDSLLRQNEAIKAGNVGFWDWDLKSNKVQYSKEWKSQIGYEDHEIGDDFEEWRSRVHPDDLAPIVEKVNQSIAEKRLHDRAEFRFRHKNGSYRWILAQAAILQDEEGNPVRMLGSHIDITDQKRLEEELRKNERLLKEAQHVAKIGHWELDSPSGTPLWSEEIFHIFGLDPKDSPPSFKAHRDIVHPEDWPSLNRSIQRLTTHGTPFDIVFRILRSNDETGWMHAIGVAERDENGRVTRMFGTAQDITELKQAEDKLRTSELWLRSIYSALDEGVLVLTGDRKLMSANKAAQRIFGYSSDELFNHSAEILHVDQEHYEEFGRRINESFDSNKAAHFEFELKRKNGDVFPSEHTVSLLKNETDESVGMVSIVRDITDRKNAEKALRQSRDRLNTLVNNLIDSIVVTDKEGTIQFVNNAACELLGRKREVLIGTALGLPMDTDNLFDIEATTPDGEKRYAEVKANTIDWEGKSAYLLSLRDITLRREAMDERDEMREQFEQAQKLESIGRLAGGVAHDFNNMLSVIRGNTDLALLEASPADPLYKKLEEIQRAAERSTNIIRQLLAFARKQVVSPEVLYLNDTLEGMLKMLRRLIGEDIDLVWKPDTNLWLVNVDPSQIDQILANLCVNARDAISGVGKVTIETQNVILEEADSAKHGRAAPGEYVMLSVTDNGSGMDSETLDKIFEPFFTTKEVGKGTGLGLSTVYGIVTQNEGFVNAYSEPGKGTTIRIYLPRYQGKVDKEVNPEKTEMPRGRGETVLIVEDDPTVLDLSKKILEYLGYDVLATESPLEAVEIIREHDRHIHLVLTDSVMPKMSGKELARKVQKIRPGIKILFMSGYTATTITSHGLLPEGVQFIDKPLVVETVARKVREVLDIA